MTHPHQPAHRLHRTHAAARGPVPTCAWVTALLVLGVARPAAARDPLELVPAESLLCWNGQALPDTVPLAADGSSTVQTLLELGARLAGQPLDAGTRLLLRAVELCAVTIRYPHAFALIDVSAKPLDSDPAVKRVDQLRCVLVARPTRSGETLPTSRPADAFLRIIQKAVNDATDSAAATLVTRRVGSWAYQELRDRRLPEWSVIAWGYLDDCFVLTLGEDVWPLVARVATRDAPALGDDAWYTDVRRVRQDLTLIEIFVAVQRAAQKLDPLLDNRVSAFFHAWDGGPLERMHWSFGLDGRALFCLAHFRIGDETYARLYADPHAGEARLLAMVPPGARYAIYQVPIARFLRQLSTSLLAIQGPNLRARIESIWRQVMTDNDLDAERDLLDHLGEHAVLHNYPQHPLRLPLAVTAMLEIRHQPERVARTIDSLCRGFQMALDDAAAEGRGPPPIALQREDDGVWYLRYGPLAGPAWVVTDRFIVLSWSPQALREYMASVRDMLRPCNTATAPAVTSDRSVGSN